MTREYYSEQLRKLNEELVSMGDLCEEAEKQLNDKEKSQFFPAVSKVMCEINAHEKIMVAISGGSDSDILMELAGYNKIR